jgi:hypothetical protein
MGVKACSHVTQADKICIKITKAFTEDTKKICLLVSTKKIRIMFFNQGTYLLMMKKFGGCSRN